MKNRIDCLFSEKKDLLSVYYTAGFPYLDATVEVAKTLAKKGADLLEIGIPFSDPLADGVVIQKSSQQALRNGMSLSLLFEQLQQIRDEVSIPILLMGYLNPIMQYGLDPFFAKCKEVGIDGVIIPDLPFMEYQNRVKEIADNYGVHMTMLITPETSDERIRLIDEAISGFLYLVSSSATTGVQKSFGAEKKAYFKRVEAMSLKHPCLIGFGIANKASFQAACEHSSGAIVGSRFIELLEQYPTDLEKAVRELWNCLGLCN